MKKNRIVGKSLSNCSHPTKLRQSERGQSLVELAMSLTMIMLLLAGAVDFSIAYFSFSAMQDAAQEGALYGSINPDDEDGIISRVRSASTNPVDLADEISCRCGRHIAGGCVRGERSRGERDL